MGKTSKILTVGLVMAWVAWFSQCNWATDKNVKKDLVETLNDEWNKNKELNDSKDTVTLPIENVNKSDTAPDNIEISNGCFEVNISNLEWTPFFWSRRMIAPSYWNLLWFSQATDIMTNNNAKWKEFDVTNWVDEKESISIPLIYPELADYFPADWSSLANGAFSKYKDVKANDLIVVTQCKNWKNALAYYKNWKLTLATYVSIGTRWRRTVSWEYDLKHDQIRRRSHRYHNSAMPYSIWITWGYYLHQGWSNWKPQSHWCVRVPGLYQKWLYEHLPKENSKIILDWLYEPTL